MHASYRDERRYNLVMFTGTWDLREFSQLLESLLESAPKRRLLLIDLTAVPNDHLSTLERYKLGVAAATLSARVQRVATLARPEQIDPEHFGETVARNKGLDLRVFSDPRQTRAWLLEGARSKTGPS
jgi:hypothetical protein